jgi:Flp pilus assembly protein TadD
LQLATQYISAGETFAAIEQMEAARSLGASDEPVSLRLAQLYDSLGEFEAAGNVLAEAAAKPSASVALRMAFSKTLRDLGDFQGAAEAVRPLLPQWQSLPANTQQYVARALLLAGDAEEASKLLPPQTTDADWLVLRGLAAGLLGQADAATQALTQATERNPQDAWNLTLLGQAWRTAHDSGKALQAFTQATELPNAPLEAFLGAAQLLTEAGRLPEAAAMLRHIGASDQKNPDYWQVQSLFSQRQKQPVIEQLARGYAAFYGGDPWQAEALWNAALPLAKGDDARELYADLLNSASLRQDPQTILHYANAAATRWPRDPYFLKRLADERLRQSMLPDALAAAEQLQQVAPPEQGAQVAELLSRIALDSGKPDLLQQSAQRNETLDPKDPAPYLHLAEWQYAQGRTPDNLERTRKLYESALAVAPQDAEAQARLGIVLRDLNRPQDAIASLLHALTLDSRVLEGVPNIQLTQLYQQQGRTPESAFETKWYNRLHTLKEAWPPLLKALRQDRPVQDWKALGEMALNRHEKVIALCAFTRATRLAPNDPTLWQGLAAVQKRFEWFEAALTSMRKAYLLSKHAPANTEAARFWREHN